MSEDSCGLRWFINEYNLMTMNTLIKVEGTTPYFVGNYESSEQCTFLGHVQNALAIGGERGKGGNQSKRV